MQPRVFVEWALRTGRIPVAPELREWLEPRTPVPTEPITTTTGAHPGPLVNRPSSTSKCGVPRTFADPFLALVAASVGVLLDSEDEPIVSDLAGQAARVLAPGSPDNQIAIMDVLSSILEQARDRGPETCIKMAPDEWPAHLPSRVAGMVEGGFQRRVVRSGDLKKRRQAMATALAVALTQRHLCSTEGGRWNITELCRKASGYPGTDFEASTLEKHLRAAKQWIKRARESGR